MDRQSVIGLVLIGLIVLTYGIFTQKDAAIAAEKQRIEDSISASRNVENNARAAGLDAPPKEVVSDATQESSSFSAENDSIRALRQKEAARSSYGIFYPSAAGSDGTFTIENEKLEATVSAKGGYIQKVRLKEFTTYDGAPLILFDERSQINIRLRAGSNGFINTKDLYFEPNGSGISLEGEGTESFSMRLRTADPSKYVDFIYTIKGDNYEVGFDVDLVGLDQEIDLNYGLLMEWDMDGLHTEKSLEYEETIASVFYKPIDEDRDFLSETSNDETELESRTQWVAFKQTFFSAVAMSKDGFPKDEGWISVTKLDEEREGAEAEITKKFNATLTLPMYERGGTKGGFTFYFGPNDYDILSEYGNDMDRIINLGWGIFGWMNKWLVIPIFNLLENKIASYGIIILILTIIIKLILFPLTYKNYLSSAKMKVLKPEIEELNKKYENEKDPMKKQQAQMALYRKTGVNPMAGCIPMVIQMPILYAMFRFFPSSIELRQQSFLWADDLSSYDSIAQLPFEIPFYGDHVSLFTILMAVSTLLYTRMNSSQMPASQPGMPNMKTIMMLFPIMMLFFFNSFASGLSYYYLAANVISMGQMYLIKEVIIDDKKLRAQIEANKKKPTKKSAFQKRLEDAAKQRAKK